MAAKLLDQNSLDAQFDDHVAVALAIKQTLAGPVAALARQAAERIEAGGKVVFFGNGGSAADAQHLAAEFLSRFVAERRPLPAIAITTDTSTLTAIGNDYGFEQVFVRQVQGLGRKGDVFLGISTSGRSPNVIAALRAARDIGMTTVGFTGSNGGAMRDLCDHLLVAPSGETAIIQQVHIVAGHAICGLVEQGLAPEPSARA
jgi:D-sedoheptulose 7-phosphate isomerase